MGVAFAPAMYIQPTVFLINVLIFHSAQIWAGLVLLFRADFHNIETCSGFASIFFHQLVFAEFGSAEFEYVGCHTQFCVLRLEISKKN